jgi:hypothetical protein
LAAFRLLIITATAAGLLAACTVREDIAYSNQQGWQRFKSEPWGERLAAFSGLTALVPPPADKERAADAALCNHPRGSNRVVTQSGIEDSVAARRCAVSPYPTAGYRLRGR